MAEFSDKSNTPNNLPRGTDWMPSSPPVKGVPEVWASGQGGLLDVVTDKAYAQNRTIYFCYAERTAGGGQGFCVNLSVDTGSLDLMKFCRKLDVLYIDTVVEPWLGFYFDKNMKNSERTNYALRETVRRKSRKGEVTLRIADTFSCADWDAYEAIYRLS